MTAWTFCLAAELGEAKLHERLDNYLAPKAITGFRVDPYMALRDGSCHMRGLSEQRCNGSGRLRVLDWV